jgi:hypothetical protein
MLSGQVSTTTLAKVPCKGISRTLSVRYTQWCCIGLLICQEPGQRLSCKAAAAGLTCKAATSLDALVSLILAAMAGSASTSLRECL